MLGALGEVTHNHPVLERLLTLDVNNSSPCSQFHSTPLTEPPYLNPLLLLCKPRGVSGVEV